MTRGTAIGNPWQALRRLTPAHIGLGRAGVSVPTHPWLAFQLAHARARDAVHDPIDVPALRASIEALGLTTLALHSAACDRATYLQRPDLGRRVDAESQRTLDAFSASERPDRFDLAVIVADGLSSRAVHRHAAPLIGHVLMHLRDHPESWRLAPVAVVQQGRVAIGDVIGAALGARITVVLIGERPGLSSPDSLGAYLTWHPRQGRTDAERNCLSNIRPEGLGYVDAAHRLVGLIQGAMQRQLSGVRLKDQHPIQASTSGARVFLLDE